MRRVILSDGRGDTVIGRNLYPKVPDMSATDTQQLSEANSITSSVTASGLQGCPRGVLKTNPKPFGIW